MSQNLFKTKQVFNENGDDALTSRQLIGGNATGIMNLNSIKYQWATKLMNAMVGNFWLPEKVDLVNEKVTLKELSVDELNATKNTLSFLIALDSMQVNNLPNLADYITAPEVNGLFTVQAFQELIHSKSYQYILNELFPNTEREEIYNLWRTNPLLLKRNKFIADQYELFNNDKTLVNFKRAIAADYALEGIYFYNGFQFFYQLAARNKLSNVAKIIKYIENDEVTHVSMFAHIIKDLFDMNNANDRAIIIDAITEACNQEIEWGYDVYGDRILGVSKESTETYVKFLGNQRSKLVGTGTIFKGYDKNPYSFLDAAKKGNFFETKVTEYSRSEAIDGWNDF